MLALVFDRKLRLRNDYPPPEPAKGEALVAVRLAGICRTDLEILKGYMRFRGVMGHEFVGTVVNGPANWAGKRVVAEINCPCGKCEMCNRSLGNHCPNRTVLGIDGRDGVFAESVAVPVANLHEVPDAVTDDQAVFVEPLAAAFQILRQVNLKQSDCVAVLGDGRLGQLAARVLTGRTARLVLVGRHNPKLKLAQNHGIETARADDPAPSAEADVVVDATGNANGFILAMRMVRPRGTIVLKSTFADAAATDLAPLVINEVTVIGSRCGPFPDAIAALAAKRVDVTDLITARFPLERGLEALAAAGSPQNVKVVIDVRRDES